MWVLIFNQNQIRFKEIIISKFCWIWGLHLLKTLTPALKCVHREVNKIWSKTVTVYLGSGTLERWIRFRCHLAVICCYVSAFCCIYKKEGSTSHLCVLCTSYSYSISCFNRTSLLSLSIPLPNDCGQTMSIRVSIYTCTQK